ncbi:MAG: hypothetical protein HZT40_21650 [Candidatus Thiothrix singaporensis]|uniref:Uncharacterized protein n=1 Tax=Candidatus Thiothrix singaporensis TaxID=2799669 RepID=A0A7L6AXN2_9GAMM|nr:MAG: hypothetical protein HZT40_21650 [Candidatus Thiothrix singaporensis]
MPVQAEALATTSPEHLRACLQAVGLLGEPLGEGRYAVGEAFLSLVCFLGCSPDIELTPQADKPFCYVQLPQTAEAVTLELIRKPPVSTASWVLVGNVHEAEAVPDAALLDALESASGCRWKYAYRR